MYEALDLLRWNAAEVENAVFFHVANLFNLVVDVIFYGTTTASFSIDQEDEEGEAGPGFRRFGHSKKGTWSPQVVVALAVTREGLPVRSWVFPGNTPDV
jgi:transposase